MTSDEIRKRFLKFFEKRGHCVISSSSLIPEGDSSTLFTTAGMQPLVPYLLGQTHPEGKRLVNVQKCVRTVDIDEVGDSTHLTFFEMLGNWSLGDYFKEEAITWSYEFLTSKEEGLGLDPKRLYITVFEGDENAPRDDTSAEVWKSLGIPEHRIYYHGASDNWWPAVEGNDTWTGPTGPDTEMFYDITPEGLGDLTPEEFEKADEAQQVVEIWNDVFMQYEKKDGKVVGQLSQKNVDTGAGLERIAAVMQGKKNVFETDLFTPLLEKIKSLSTREDVQAQRIIADHVRAAVFMIADGLKPANTDRGYILRRLLRRAVRHSDSLGMEANASLPVLIETIIASYEDVYPALGEQKNTIRTLLSKEVVSFKKTLAQGMREFEKLKSKGSTISGADAFVLFSTYGFPIEMTQELAQEHTMTVDIKGFEKEMEKHQTLSRTATVGKFKGGLGDLGEASIQLHTATHLLQQALRDVLGEHVMQKGSNITPERLRFDFSHPQKMTDEQIKQVETIVNSKIHESLPVTWEEMTVEEAKEKGALGVFDDKYGEKIKVYSVGEYSKEICGGPHVANTSELGSFKIKKEEAVSSGVRRIKAVLGEKQR